MGRIHSAALSILLTTVASFVRPTPRNYFDKVKSAARGRSGAAAVHVVNYKHNVLFPTLITPPPPPPPPPFLRILLTARDLSIL